MLMNARNEACNLPPPPTTHKKPQSVVLVLSTSPSADAPSSPISLFCRLRETWDQPPTKFVGKGARTRRAGKARDRGASPLASNFGTSTHAAVCHNILQRDKKRLPLQCLGDRCCTTWPNGIVSKAGRRCAR